LTKRAQEGGNLAFRGYFALGKSGEPKKKRHTAQVNMKKKRRTREAEKETKKFYKEGEESYFVEREYEE